MHFDAVLTVHCSEKKDILEKISNFEYQISKKKKQAIQKIRSSI